nr:hypothetical protein [Tanacetum cinerariifolium]
NASTSTTNLINTASTPLSTVVPSRAFNDGEISNPGPSKYALQDDPSMPQLEDIYASPSEGIFTNSSYDDKGVVTDFNNLETTGHRQEAGIDYDEVFAHVVKLEAIKIFLAFASYTGFIVYQMDVKSAFLYGTIDEEVYVSQPPGFVDPKFPNKEKSRYRRRDIMLAQVYVDDIIFGSTKKSWCDEFEELTKNRFQMSCVKVVKKVAKSDLDSDTSIRLHFVLDCVLSSVAFCLSEDLLLCFARDELCQTQNCTAFCHRLRFASEVLRFDLAFCYRRSCDLL